jgi:hypothetical protein
LNFIINIYDDIQSNVLQSYEQHKEISECSHQRKLEPAPDISDHEKNVHMHKLLTKSGNNFFFDGKALIVGAQNYCTNYVEINLICFEFKQQEFRQF